jgi:DNA-binding NarL/FixJ family response regulator
VNAGAVEGITCLTALTGRHDRNNWAMFVQKRKLSMVTTDRIRVLVVDDHPIMRAGFSGEINSQADMEVVGEANDGADALEAFRRCRPDVTLMDIRMPKVDGVAAVAAIRKDFPTARVIVLTTIPEDVRVVRAFRAGAVGFLLKSLLREELTNMIRAVHTGQRRVPADIALQLAAHATEEDITDRELEVLRGVAQGQSNRLIGAHLDISENTVKNHIKNILSKLNASDRTHAVTIALQRGLMEL